MAFMKLEHQASDFDVKIAAGLVVLADRIQIQQVFLNLIRNAVEAMEESPFQRLVITAKKAAPGMIEVPSPTADELGSQSPKACSPFLDHQGEGQGLGLSICRTIVDSARGPHLGGAVKAGGVAFRFTLSDGSRRTCSESGTSARRGPE